MTMFGSRRSIGLLNDISQALRKNLSLRCQRVQCLRIGNAEIPNDKRLKFALQRIHGIGRQRAHQILTDLSIENKLAKDLTGVEIHSLRDEISKYMTGEELKRCVRSDIQKLVDSRCYRGFNHVCNLPCRGQRTSTNARTRKDQKNHERSNWGAHQSLAETMQKLQERS